MFFEIKKRLGKNLSQSEKPDDLQLIANHPVFFVCMMPSMMEITKKRPSANSWCDDLADAAFDQKSSKQRKLRTKSVIKDLRIIAQFGICILDADECVRICFFDRLTQVGNLVLLSNDDDDVGPFAGVNAGTVQKGCAMNEIAQGICDLV